MRNLAIIPARSGSKGLKDKNIKLLKGKPLIGYSIDAAKESGMFDEIMVSTDSNEYAEIAIELGAKVPFLRPKDLSGDDASSWDVVKDVISNYRNLGFDFDNVALLQPTSPLRTSIDIINGFEAMKIRDANAVVSVCEMDHSPLWANTLPEDNSMKDFVRPEVVSTSRQNLPTYYRINGALYIVKIDYLFGTENIYLSKSYAIIMRKENSIDIDNEFDFNMARILVSDSSDRDY